MRKIKTSKNIIELRLYAFGKLVKLAEYCLWAQTYAPHDHAQISDRLKKLKYKYDLFGKFKLLDESCKKLGYKVYFDEAIVRSEVPDWFMKNDPSIKKEPAETTA